MKIKRDILDDMGNQVNIRNMPRIVISDFKMIFHQSEKLRGLLYNKNDNEYYCNILERVVLYDLGFQGYKFTRNNQKQRARNIHERPDRAVQNA